MGDRRPNKVGEGRPVYGNRDGYRRNQDGGDKTAEAGAGNQAFQYKGGYGRGNQLTWNKFYDLLNLVSRIEFMDEFMKLICEKFCSKFCFRKIILNKLILNKLVLIS